MTARRILAHGLCIALLGAAIVFGPSAGIVGAARAAETAAQPDIALSGKLVESFMTSYPDVKASADKLSKKYKVHASGDSAAGRWQGWMAARGAWTELDAIVTPYGFTGFQNWLMTTIAIAKAYAFAKEGDNMDSQMAKALAEIKNNPNIPAAQKEMLLKQMQSSTGAIAGMKPPKANIDAVTPYLDQLAALFGK